MPFAHWYEVTITLDGHGEPRLNGCHEIPIGHRVAPEREKGAQPIWTYELCAASPAQATLMAKAMTPALEDDFQRALQERFYDQFG